jgi:hypothetical protein
MCNALIGIFIYFHGSNSQVTHRALPIDFLEFSISAIAIPFLVIVVWMQRFDGRFWWVEPCQYV